MVVLPINYNSVELRKDSRVLKFQTGYKPVVGGVVLHSLTGWVDLPNLRADIKERPLADGVMLPDAQYVSGRYLNFVVVTQTYGLKESRFGYR